MEEKDYLSIVEETEKGKNYDLRLRNTTHSFISVEFRYDALVAGLVEWHLQREPFDVDAAFEDEEFIEKLEQQQGGAVSRERVFEMYKEHVTHRVRLIADNYMENINSVIGQMATPLVVEAPTSVWREIDKKEGKAVTASDAQRIKSRAHSARWQSAREWLDVPNGKPRGAKNADRKFKLNKFEDAVISATEISNSGVPSFKQIATVMKYPRSNAINGETLRKATRDNIHQFKAKGYKSLTPAALVKEVISRRG